MYFHFHFHSLQLGCSRPSPCPCRSRCQSPSVEIWSLRLYDDRLAVAKMLMNINANGWVFVAAYWVCNWAERADAEGAMNWYIYQIYIYVCIGGYLWFDGAVSYLIRSQVLHDACEEGVTSHRRCHICNGIAELGINCNRAEDSFCHINNLNESMLIGQIEKNNTQTTIERALQSQFNVNHIILFWYHLFGFCIL